jgi:hypothetical protein
MRNRTRPPTGGLLRLADRGKQSQIRSSGFSSSLASQRLTFGSAPLFPGLFPRSFRRHHLKRLPDQLPQLIPPHGVEPVQHYPLVPPHIRRRTNVLTLNQLRKSLRHTLEAKPRIVQTGYRKNLPANLEAEIITPLHILGGLRKCQAILANGIDIHALAES